MTFRRQRILATLLALALCLSLLPMSALAAETTATTRLPRLAAWVMMRAAAKIRSRPSREVPPNFCTISMVSPP